MEMSKENPARWVTPDFPTNGYYKHDEEINWINSLELNLSESVCPFGRGISDKNLANCVIE